jgi:hypothetical protein
MKCKTKYEMKFQDFKVIGLYMFYEMHVLGYLS